MVEHARPMRSTVSEKKTQKVFILDGHLGQYMSEWIPFAIMWDQNPSCVIEEVVKIDQVHLVLHEESRQGL